MMASLSIDLRLGSNYISTLFAIGQGWWKGLPHPPKGNGYPSSDRSAQTGKRITSNLLISKGQNHINKKMPQKILTKTNQFSISTERLAWKSNAEQIKTPTFLRPANEFAFWIAGNTKAIPQCRQTDLWNLCGQYCVRLLFQFFR